MVWKSKNKNKGNLKSVELNEIKVKLKTVTNLKTRKLDFRGKKKEWLKLTTSMKFI